MWNTRSIHLYSVRYFVCELCNMSNTFDHVLNLTAWYWSSGIFFAILSSLTSCTLHTTIANPLLMFQFSLDLRETVVNANLSGLSLAKVIISLMLLGKHSAIFPNADVVPEMCFCLVVENGAPLSPQYNQRAPKWKDCSRRLFADEWLTLVNRFCASPPWSILSMGLLLQGWSGRTKIILYASRVRRLTSTSRVASTRRNSWAGSSKQTTFVPVSDKVQQRMSSKDGGVWSNVNLQCLFSCVYLLNIEEGHVFSLVW